MNQTPAITLNWIQDSKNKISELPITQAALNLINKSETLKANIRAYAVSINTDGAQLVENSNAGSYQIPFRGELGLMKIGSNRFDTPEGTFNILSHELGHFKIEEPGAAIANARGNAQAAGDRVAYEAACNLTEGYAKYNEFQSRLEALETNRATAAAQGRQLTTEEQNLEDRWTGKGGYKLSGDSKDYLIVKSIEDFAGQSLNSYTTEDVRSAAAFALGENNKNALTSTDGQTYLNFCRLSANAVISSGATQPTNPPSETLGSEYDARGNYLGSSVVADSAGGVKAATLFDEFGTTTGTITDTPSGTGDLTRSIVTTVDGQPVEITQQASAADLANGQQPGDFTTTAVKINGEPAVNNDIIANVIDENYQSAIDIIEARDTGEFKNITEAGDATNPNGTTPSLVTITGRIDWWEDPAIGNLASDAVSLISALRGGKPLPIATAGFNLLSHSSSNPVIAELAGALSAVGSVAGLVDSLKKGDLGRILIDGGGVARSAVTLYNQSLLAEINTRFISLDAAEKLVGANPAATELVNSYQASGELLQNLGQAIAVLNIINSVVNGGFNKAVAASGAIAPKWAEDTKMQTATINHYKKRSCLRPYKLGYSTKTYLKTASNDASSRVAA